MIMNYYCPQCHGVIYDRTEGRCAVCGSQLSEGSFLSPFKVDMFRREAIEIEESHRRDSGRREVEEQERRANHAACTIEAASACDLQHLARPDRGRIAI